MRIGFAIGLGCSLLLIGSGVLNAQQLSTREAYNSKAAQYRREAAEISDARARFARSHRFFDVQGKIANAVNFGMTALDAVGTCRTLASGGREYWLPTQRCAPASAMIIGGMAMDVSLSYLLHRTGHHRLERIVEIAGSADSITGITYTVIHGGRW